jgi:transposase InsO family protein
LFKNFIQKYTEINKTFKARNYRMPFAKKALEKAELKRMKEAGVIVPSNSDCSSPIVLIKKPDGSIRFCVDYRKLNEITIKDNYPMPNIEDKIDALGGSRVFTSLDLTSGYWQFEMEPESRRLTAFTCSEGLFEFRDMPFGLCNAGATFQRAIEDMLRGIKYATAYIDDIIVFSKMFDEHLRHLEEVFKRLREAGLKVKTKKSKIGFNETKFLGYIVNHEGIKINPEKCEVIKNYKVPKSAKDVKKFLGLTSYYRSFIDNYSEIAEPLTKLTQMAPNKRLTKFAWSTECQQSFEEFIKRLSSTPILVYPNFSKKFRLITDASDVGIGAILCQEDDENKERVISYASRTLSKPERNYNTREKELLAIVWAVEKFKPYLYGVEFELFTDHQSLVYIQTMKNPSARIHRWILKLQEFNATIKYKKGVDNVNADVMSRLSEYLSTNNQMNEKSSVNNQSNDEQRIKEQTNNNNQLQINSVQTGANSEIVDENRDKVIEAQKDDKWARATVKKLKHKGLYKRFVMVDGLLCKKVENKYQLYLPQTYRRKALLDCHDRAGHLGEDKTIKKLQDHFVWPAMVKDGIQYIKSCPDCQRAKPSHVRRTTMMEVETTMIPGEVWGVDVLGPFKASNDGNKYITVWIDHASKWVEAFASKDVTAKVIAAQLTDGIIFRHSAPKKLLSDNGTNWVSKLIREVTSAVDTHKIESTAYRPQTNGLVERFNKTLAKMLSFYVKDNQSDWDRHIQKVLFAYNTSSQRSTKKTPFEMMTGRQYRLPSTLANHTPKTSFVEDLKSMWLEAAENMKRSRENNKDLYDTKAAKQQFKVGELVMVDKPAVEVGLSRKLRKNNFEEPTRVKAIKDNNVLVEVGKKKKIKYVHVDRVKRFYERS